MSATTVNHHVNTDADVPPMGAARFALGNPFVGASQLKTYLRKPRAWWATYVVGIPEPESYALKFGTTLHAPLERWALNEEMYPEGWAKDVTLADADLIKRLAESAIRGNIVARGEGVALGFDRDVEAEFCLPILEPEDGKPAVAVRGTIDCPRSWGIDDYKTTKSIARYAKEGHDLQTDVQLNLYAYAWLWTRRSHGLWDPASGEIKLRHVYFQKGSQPTVEVREALVTIAQVEERWEALKPIVRQMRDLAWQHLVDGKDHQVVGARWYQVPCVVASREDRLRALSGELACGDYGGCGYAGLCADVEDLTDYRRKNFGNGNGGGSNVGIFDDRIAGLQNTPASTNGATATAAPPATPAPAPAAPPAATAPPAPPAAPPGPRLREFAAGCPPWARPECGACVDKALDKVTGLRLVGGGACFICSSKSKAEGRVHGDMFEHAVDNGLYLWAAKSEFSDKIPEGLRQGSYRMAQPTQVAVTPPPAAPTPAPAPPAPPAQPPAPQGPPATGQNAPAPAAPPSPSTGDGKPVKHKFTLCLGCAPDGEKAIRLEVVHRKHADLLAAEYSERLKTTVIFNDIPAFERWDKLAAKVPSIIEAEKFGTGWVVCFPDKGGDLARFVDAVAPFAATVIRARG
jgi:pyruvate/2-oxoglutarate dehydrogenase complex dihydrolipoamide acyltransferase (E2) component